MVPSKHGLAAIFHALHQAKWVAKEEEVRFVGTRREMPKCAMGTPPDGAVLACPVQVDQQVIISLPTENQWQYKMVKDPDLQLVVRACKGPEPLNKCLLRDKGYWAPFTNGQLEVNDGVVCYYEEAH